MAAIIRAFQNEERLTGIIGVTNSTKTGTKTFGFYHKMCNLKKENENAVGADLFLLYESNNAAITLKVFLLIHFNLNYGAVLFPHPPKQTWFMTLCKRIPADHQNKNQ